MALYTSAPVISNTSATAPPSRSRPLWRAMWRQHIVVVLTKYASLAAHRYPTVGDIVVADDHHASARQSRRSADVRTWSIGPGSAPFARFSTTLRNRGSVRDWGLLLNTVVLF